jgi:hypothetical protein
MPHLLIVLERGGEEGGREGQYKWILLLGDRRTESTIYWQG